MYFITSMDIDNDTRCVGYYSDLKKAIEIVENNTGDLNEEGYYPYIVIENIKEGIYQYDQNPMWFEYDKSLNKYVKSKRPSYIDPRYVGFSIG